LGSQTNVYNAVRDATQAQVNAQNLTSIFKSIANPVVVQVRDYLTKLRCFLKNFISHIKNRFSGISKLYIAFFAVNAVWLFGFSLFSFFSATQAGFALAGGFILMFGALFFLYGAFGMRGFIATHSELTRWLYVSVVIIIGLVLRILAREIFRTEQVQDFGRAHEVYLMLQYSPFAPAETWAEHSWYQLYFARFPAWMPFFVITRAVYDIFGANVRNMIALNYVLYMASAAVFYAAAKRAFSWGVAFAATAIFVFNPNLVVWAGVTSPDHFFMLLFCCMFYFLVRGQKNYKFLALAAVFAALTQFFKPIGLIFLIAFFCVEIFMLVVSRNEARSTRSDSNPSELQSNFPTFKKIDFRRWAIFAGVFIAVFLAGTMLVRLETRRVFHVNTYSSTGKFMVFAWATNDDGWYDHGVAFAKFNRLMTENDYNLPLVLNEMSQYAREVFREANLPNVLWQKARLTFGDEGVLGWTFHSYDPAHSAAARRVLERPLWIGFTAHIFVIMSLAAAGVFFAIFDKQNTPCASPLPPDEIAKQSPKSNQNRAVILFLITTIIGCTLVLLLGIAQARYRLLLYPQLSILAAYGVHKMLSFCQTFSQKVCGFGQSPRSCLSSDEKGES